MWPRVRGAAVSSMQGISSALSATHAVVCSDINKKSQGNKQSWEVLSKGNTRLDGSRGQDCRGLVLIYKRFVIGRQLKFIQKCLRFRRVTGPSRSGSFQREVVFRYRPQKLWEDQSKQELQPSCVRNKSFLKQTGVSSQQRFILPYRLIIKPSQTHLASLLLATVSVLITSVRLDEVSSISKI